MPQPSQPPPPHTWAVTHQEEEPDIDDNGKPTTIHHVHFRTNTGHESTITLPDSHFNAVNVAQQINHKAGEIVKVHTMTSENAPHPAN